MTTNPSVLISGAGIAGPTLAYWLLAGGFRPTLVERAPSLRTGGYVIDFWGAGYDVADKMAVVPELEKNGYRVKELRLVDSRGRRVGGFDAEVFRRITGGRYVSLPRSQLAMLLLGAVRDRCEVMFGDSIVALEESDAGVRTRFERSSERMFDLVIGADGLHSNVRKLVFGAQSQFERYLGYVVAAFESRGYRPRDEGTYVSFTAPGRQVARFALDDDRTMFLFVFAAAQPPAAEPHDILAQKAILHRAFDGAGWECPRILAALDRCTNLYFDRVSQIRMKGWSRGRVALVGDAAFCPSLLAGQGSALAMTASYVLAGELTRAQGAFRQAFSDYEKLLRPFMAEKQEAAASFAKTFAPKTRFGLYLRNQITKAFRFPIIADLVIGNSLVDRLALPDYPFAATSTFDKFPQSARI
jgi:2-polyprenyl-6-methoxyphenol hydroxylase-like FAD-dependent oxidoreductase